MKKRAMVLFLVLVMVFGTMTACGSPATTTTAAPAESTTAAPTTAESTTSATEAGGVFGLSIPTLSAEFFTGLQLSMEQIFGAAGYEVKTVSAELDIAKQVSDIENLVAQGAKGILVGPMDPASLQDACIAAREQGTKIITFVPFADINAYDALVGVDEGKLGEACAKLASDWVDEKFASAADKSVEAILITNPNNETSTLRSNALATIANNSKINLVKTYALGAADTPDKVQEFMGMALTEFPNLKVVICHDSSFAIAANEVLARTAGVKASDVGIFGISSSEAILNAIKASATDESMIRGVIELQDLASHTMSAWTAIQTNTVPEDKFFLGAYSQVNVSNVDEYLK